MVKFLAMMMASTMIQAADPMPCDQYAAKAQEYLQMRYDEVPILDRLQMRILANVYQQPIYTEEHRQRAIDEFGMKMFYQCLENKT